MQSLRIQSLWWLITLATHVCSINLIGVLETYPELSVLASYLNGTSNLNKLLSNANNFTFLAPDNDAIGKFLSENDNTLGDDLLQALSQYSLLKGGYPTLSFSDTPQFAPSSLVNATYANVTAGQGVELVLSSSGKPQVVSGDKNISTFASTDIVCTGGIVHIINEVLSIPITAVAQIPTAKLQYFVEILNQGGFLNSANSYVNKVLEIPDVTLFIPNSQQAVSLGNGLLKNTSSEDLQALFEYHVLQGFVGYSSLLKDGMSMKTAQGENLTITIRDGDTYVNAAKIITSDYIVANGVVHVIDNLLNPNNTAGPPPPAARPATPNPSPSALNNAPTTPTPTPTPTPTHSPSSSSSGLSTGAKAGIGVGAAAAGLLVLGALFWCYRSRKAQRERESPPGYVVGPPPMAGVPPTNDHQYGTTAHAYGGGPIHRQGSEKVGARKSPPPPLQVTTGGTPYDMMQDPNKDSEPASSISPSSPSVPPRSPNHRLSDAYHRF